MGQGDELGILPRFCEELFERIKCWNEVLLQYDLILFKGALSSFDSIFWGKCISANNIRLCYMFESLSERNACLVFGPRGRAIIWTRVLIGVCTPLWR